MCFPSSFVPPRSVVYAAVAALLGVAAHAQPTSVDIELITGALPNTVDVRLRANGASWDELVSSLAFTVRWQEQSGTVPSATLGGANTTAFCSGPAFSMAGEAAVEDGTFKYRTYYVFGMAPLGAPIEEDGCGISLPADTWRVVATITVSNSASCTALSIVNDAFTSSSNRDFYLALNGTPATGAIVGAGVLLGNCEPCTTPVITSATSSGSICPGGSVGLTSTIAPSFPALMCQWTAPGSSTPFSYLPSVTVAQAAVGDYTLVVHNICGSDTALVPVAMDTTGIGACVPPVINSTQNNSPVPQYGDLQLDASVNAAGPCLYYHWSGPGAASQIGEGHQLTIPVVHLGNAGTYTLVVGNACGSDTATFEVEVTQGPPPPCDPPVITSTTSNSPICGNGLLELSATVSGSAYLMQYRWTANNNSSYVYSDSLSVIVQPNASAYEFRAWNTCGSASQLFPVVLESAGSNGSLPVCSNDSWAMLEGPLATHSPGGTWSFNGEPHSNAYYPVIDESGAYVYTVQGSAVCGGQVFTATVEVTEVLTPYAGPDTTITLCSNEGPYALFEALGPAAATGGHWFRKYGMISLIPSNGVYDPSVDLGGLYFYFLYGECGDFSKVIVQETTATDWYADTDNDGLGDALTSVLACVPPEGYVSNSSDDCPSVTGQVGSACDDGLAYTENDVLDPLCVCAGTLMCSPSQLTTTLDPVASCGATQLLLNGASTIWATEVTGANKYQFRFTRPGYVRNIAKPTRSLTLTKWATAPLKPGRTYSVVVRASFDGGTSWCAFGEACSISIGYGNEGSRSMEVSDADDVAPIVSVYPNPNDGDQLSLMMTDVSDGIDHVDVVVYDALGRELFTRTCAVNDGEVNTNITLRPILEVGLYVMDIAAGEEHFTQRVIVQR